MPVKDQALFLTHARWFTNELDHLVFLSLISDSNVAHIFVRLTFEEVEECNKKGVNVIERAEIAVFNKLRELQIKDPEDGSIWIRTDKGFPLYFWQKTEAKVDPDKKVIFQ